MALAFYVGCAQLPERGRAFLDIHMPVTAALEESAERGEDGKHRVRMPAAPHMGGFRPRIRIEHILARNRDSFGMKQAPVIGQIGADAYSVLRQRSFQVGKPPEPMCRLIDADDEMIGKAEG